MSAVPGNDSLAPMPLEGLTVLDLSRAYLGPYATFLMAKAGANVVKIESFDGDMLRARAGVSQGSTLPFAMLNTNKRSMTLNLRSPQGQALLVELSKQADVLVENFAPGVMDRLSVGWETLRAVNPRLIYASGSGYGLSGPDRDRQAMDICVQAVSGAMSITGFPDGPPVKCGPAIADFNAGIHLYAGVVTALLQRAQTGFGQLVEVSMQEALYPSLSSSLGLLYDTGESPQPTGNRHGGMALCPYSVFPARDGWVAIACVLDEHWARLAGVMGRPEWADDERYRRTAARCARMDEVEQLVADWTRQHPAREIVMRLTEARIVVAEVRGLKEVADDPHMHGRGALEKIDDPELGVIVVPNTPLRLHGTRLPETTRRPDLGEHTDVLLKELLDLPGEEIEALRRAGAI